MDYDATLARYKRDLEKYKTDLDIIFDASNVDIQKNLTDKYKEIVQTKEDVLKLTHPDYTTYMSSLINNYSYPNKDTSKTLKDNFKTLYNKQYSQNVNLFIGMVVVFGIIVKMSFYETITPAPINTSILK